MMSQSSSSTSLTSALLQFQKHQQQQQLMQEQQQQQLQQQQQQQSEVDLNKMLLPMNYYYNLYTMQYYLKAKQELLGKGKKIEQEYHLLCLPPWLEYECSVGLSDNRDDWILLKM